MSSWVFTASVSNGSSGPAVIVSGETARSACWGSVCDIVTYVTLRVDTLSIRDVITNNLLVNMGLCGSLSTNFPVVVNILSSGCEIGYRSC